MITETDGSAPTSTESCGQARVIPARTHLSRNRFQYSGRGGVPLRVPWPATSPSQGHGEEREPGWPKHDALRDRASGFDLKHDALASLGAYRHLVARVKRRSSDTTGR